MAASVWQVGFGDGRACARRRTREADRVAVGSGVHMDDPACVRSTPAASAAAHGEGIIPACAGPTAPTCPTWRHCADHPRVRGADRENHPKATEKQGPSPRARSRRQPGILSRRDLGTIPACAGPTPRSPTSRPATRDHPRVRGADVENDAGDWGLCGPSPRARGRPGQPHGRPPARGTIPACAGPTWRPSGCVTWSRDHPRVRGADYNGSPPGGPSCGPSPRARGRLPGRDCR